jgi:sulfate adenylyltransferase subunit 2
VPPLYFAQGPPGSRTRYRSLGERDITFPVRSEACTLEDIIAELEQTRAPERAGRPMGAQEDPAAFEKLRTGGYM